MGSAGWSVLLAMVVASGCVQPHVSTAVPAAATMRPVAAAGTILSVRPVMVRSDRAPWRVALIADASATTALVVEVNGELTEFIVRTEGGATISIVQANPFGLRSGERVMILRDGPTHIARPG
jgi:outer membrane lipoprotein SlyB